MILISRTSEAQDVYEKALQFDGNNPDIYYNVSLFSVWISLGEIYENSYESDFKISHGKIL